MAANILGLGERRRPEDDMDNLLGMRKTQGMTDNAFQAAGRAPVDELWAGRYSAAVDDDEFARREGGAKQKRNEALMKKDFDVSDMVAESVRAGNPMTRAEAEGQWMNDTRDAISNYSGLDLYPGHLRSDEENPIFMTEFSDAGARWRDGSMETLHANGTSGPSFLGDVLEHDELYKHYPEAQFLPVYSNPDMAEGHGGSYYPQSMFAPDSNKQFGQIVLNGNSSDEENLGTMIHELQHFIQSQEGWEGGGGIHNETTAGYMRDQANYAEEGGSALADHNANRLDIISDRAIEQAGNEDEFWEGMNASGLGYEAYAALTGEALARDADARRVDGAQIENYYRGDRDGWDNANWNHTDGDFMPNPAMPEYRAGLQDVGLLGPFPGGFTPEIMEILQGQGQEDAKQGPLRNKDPYLKAYESLLGSK